MRSAFPVALLLAAAATVASAAAHAADDDPAVPPSGDAQEARQQYQAGTQAYQAKRFVEAALHFEAAVIQRPNAVALYTAALAWEQANRPERAADDFGRALDVPGLSAAQQQAAHEKLANLERTMGTLEVTAPEGWRVQLDANTGTLAPAHLHAMPGMHALTVQAPSAPIQHRDVTLELGKTTHLALTADAAPSTPTASKPEPAATPSAPPRPAPAPAKGSPLDVRRAAGFGAVGAGVASVAAGIILGVNALSARDAYNASPTQPALDHASGLQTWTDVVFVAGGVFLVGGAALILWPAPKAGGEPAASLAPSLGGAVLKGVF